MEADFSGWATKSGLKCSDGRTIMTGSFKHQDKARVPLVWQHGHSDPENVLGHVLLENREEGVYVHGFFNKSQKAGHARELLEHKDINSLSIWANELVERSKRVLHGTIREVSLVLSGANPGALIENVTIRHSEEGEDDEVMEDEAIIYTGLTFDDDNDDDDVSHAEGDGGSGDETIQDIYDSMNDKQKQVLHYMIGEAIAEKMNTGASADHTNVKNEEGNSVSRNVFEKGDKEKKASKEKVLSHSDVQEIVADASKTGSLKAAVENYALAHGIENIDVLFPEATQLTSAPEFFARRMEWVNNVLNGARKSPFSRVRTATADLTWEDARAKGYIKGNFKKEEFYSVARRETTPQTVYKKQKLDRDDIIDITDFDVVTWMKGEMRILLDEELARATLVGDGRDPGDEDKIREDHIRPIVSDNDFFTIKLYVNLDAENASYRDIIRAIIRARSEYRGTGQPTMYTTEAVLAEFLLLEDTLQRRIYQSLDQVASELRVSSIVPVEVLNEYPDVVAILVNMNDYNIGADRGGAVAMFDDFDIDYNQYKYLIETRCSGALVRPKSAMVINRTAADAALVTPSVPTFVQGTGVVTIPADANAEYVNEKGETLDDGAQTALAPGERVTVTAVPATGKYFASSETQTWKFYRPIS